MTTIADNIRSMAALVAEVKRAHHLTEPTVLRIVDMNFALAQGTGAPTFSGEEELPFEISPEDEVAPDQEQVLMFPADPDEVEEVLATVEHPTPLEN